MAETLVNAIILKYPQLIWQLVCKRPAAAQQTKWESLSWRANSLDLMVKLRQRPNPKGLPFLTRSPECFRFNWLESWSWFVPVKCFWDQCIGLRGKCGIQSTPKKCTVCASWCTVFGIAKLACQAITRSAYWLGPRTCSRRVTSIPKKGRKYVGEGSDWTLLSHVHIHNWSALEQGP